MTIKRKFRGKTITNFDGAEYNKYFKQMTDDALDYYNGSDMTLWIDEYTGEIFEFATNHTDEQNIVAIYKDFDNLNKNLIPEFDDDEE